MQVITHLIESFNEKNSSVQKRIDKHKESAEKHNRLMQHHHQMMEKAAARLLNAKDLITIIAARVAETLGAEVATSGPCGIFCHYLLRFTKDNRTATLTLEDNYTRERGFEFRYLTNETTQKFPKGTIGEINGGNIVTKPLPETIEELAEIIKTKFKPIEDNA